MEDGDSIDIKMEEEDKCITLLCSLPDSWDNVVVAIGSSTKFALKFENVVSSLLSKEMRRKSMENHRIDALSVRLGHTKERGKSTKGIFKARDRSKSPGDPLKRLCWK